jgi:hypothetical protein
MENLELPLIQENQGNVNTFISDETVVIAGDIAENGPEESPDEVLIENDIIQEQFQLKLETINNEILSFITQIENNANDFLKAHFYEGKDFLKLLLKYKTTIDERWVREKNDALTNNKIPQGAEIKLWVSMYDAQTQQWIENHRPQSFLNKAQLTRIALAIRIGALRTRPPRENIDFRVLCLDDLLISLDMSNRHKVIKMLLNVDNNPALAFFDDY